MKKLFLIIGVIVAIRLGCLYFFQTKMLPEPIIIAQDADFSDAIGAIHISYITNRFNPTDITAIEVGGREFYPQVEYINFDSTTSVQSFADYKYYSIRTVTFNYDFDYLDIEIEDGTEAIVHFNNGFSDTVALNRYDYVRSELIGQTMSSSSNDGTSSMGFDVEKPFTLNEIRTLDDRVKVTSIKINHKDIALPVESPVEVKEKQSLQIDTVSEYGLYFGERFDVELVGVDAQNKPVSIIVGNILNGPPSEDWINEVVKERGVR